MSAITRQLARAHDFDMGAFTAWCTAGEAVGWIANDFLRTLLEASEGELAFERGALVLRTPQNYAARSAALERIALRLRSGRHVTGWRNERYAVVSPSSGAPLFELERAAVRRFGVPARAAHLNGYTVEGDRLRIWAARRAADKPIDPGLLDNLVGGGIAAGLDATATLLKECEEEAGIDAETALRARAAGELHVRRAVADGLHDETLAAYDLELPPGFAPANRDGEVAEFVLLEPAELAERLAAGEFTVDASVVAIEFLWRRDLLADADVGRALARLRAPLTR